MELRPIGPILSEQLMLLGSNNDPTIIDQTLNGDVPETIAEARDRYFLLATLHEQIEEAQDAIVEHFGTDLLDGEIGS